MRLHDRLRTRVSESLLQLILSSYELILMFLFWRPFSSGIVLPYCRDQLILEHNYVDTYNLRYYNSVTKNYEPSVFGTNTKQQEQ